MMKPIRFGKYQLHDRISHGGMAEVFRAKTFGAAGFERTVAIKLLLPTVAMDRDFITMLVDEAKIAGQLNHANIAQIFDLGMAEGRYYIVQEYVNGKDLRAILRFLTQKDASMSIPQACHIMLKVCEGLEYAHNKRDATGRALNLVHRDVSPQNIVVSREGEVKLIDFGIAKAEGRATRTLAGLVKGKFAYMSPEQIRGLPVDRRSDVFACGIVLHELLTGKPLFRRKSEFETLKRARSAEIEPPSLINPAVSPDLDRVVLRALARHVEDRHQTAISFRDDLWEYVRSSGHFYTRNELAVWMRDNFPRTANEPEGAFDLNRHSDESDTSSTVVDTPPRRDEFAPPTVEYKTPRPDIDTANTEWGTLEDLAKGPNPDRIEYAPDLMPARSERPTPRHNELAPGYLALEETARESTRTQAGSPYALGRSMEIVTPLPAPRPARQSPPVDIEEETTLGGKRRSPPPHVPGKPALPPAAHGSSPIPVLTRRGPADPLDNLSSMAGTNPFVKAQGSLPPPSNGRHDGPTGFPSGEATAVASPPPPATKAELAASKHPIYFVGRAAPPRKSRWSAVLVAAAVFLLLLAGATSITLAVKNLGERDDAAGTK